MKKFRHSIIPFLLSLLFLPINYLGQEPEEKPVPSSLNLHQWGSLTLFHGLPSNHVRAIAQDADGILWFGTDSGLAKYDGRRIQKVTAAGLPSGRIRALKLDAEGSLWVGTDTGATVFSGGQFKPVPETDGKVITAISTVNRGQTVLVSEQGIIFKCQMQNNAVSKIQTLGPGDSAVLKLESNGVVNPLPLTSIYETKDTLVVGSRGRGLLSVSGHEVKEIVSRPRSFFVNATAVDASGHLWIGGDTSKSDSGVYQSSDLLHLQKTEGTTGAVKSLSFDQQNALWVGTDGQGAFRFKDGKPVDHFTFENTAGGLRSNVVLSVFADRENVIWLGTDRGVCRYDPHSPHIDPVSDSPGSNFVRALYKARDGRQWCGTNKGLFTRDDGVSGWRQIDDLTGKTIHSINQDQVGRILVGTAGGLYTGDVDPFSLPGWYRFTKPEKTETKVAFESIRSISYFRDAIYLASYGSGLEQLDGDNRKLIWPTDGSDSHQRNVVSLYADSTDRLWIGTAEAGAFYFDGNQVTADPGLNELHGASVWSIAGNIKDGLWLATSQGLYRYWQGKLQQILRGTDYRQVVAAEDPGSVWCATTSNGLYKVVFDDTSGAIFSRLDTEHGLPSDSIFTILPITQTKDDAVLWLGTNRGVAYYEPGKIPPIVRPVRALGKRVYQPEELPAGLHLEYPQNSLVVEVAASSSRTFPEHFQYLFTLTSDAGKVIKKSLSADPQFSMENLRPGGYKVIARAYTNDLVVSQPLEFHFEVAKAPFPWTSTALGSLLALALVALWWGYRQNRKIGYTNVALAGANQQLADTRMQLANETENERRRIARDLHDQTLSDLRRLMLLTDQLPKEKTINGQTEIDPAVFRSEIETISTEIRHICEDLSPSVLANVGLSAALEWALSNTVAHLPLEQKFEYEFSSVDDLEEQFPLEPGQQIQIYRIVQEAISNVGHHAAARHVKLNVSITETQALLITLEDDGRGFDPDNLNHGTGRGLNNIRSRASLVDADVSWIRRPEGGIIFTLRK